MDFMSSTFGGAWAYFIGIIIAAALIAINRKI